ncbi:MAG: GPW/gp25 family protein, partial [Methylococcales bacterium]|nr:GPW/gp25 family protein [Methylococcales bacterium]
MSNPSFLGTGWSFPPTFEVGNYHLNMTHKQHNINQSIDLILQTNQGERSLMPQFGSPLRSFLFRHLDAPLQNEIIDAVKSALLDYEPRITVDNVGLELLTGDQSGVAIYIDYTVKMTNSRFN